MHSAIRKRGATERISVWLDKHVVESIRDGLMQGRLNHLLVFTIKTVMEDAAPSPQVDPVTEIDEGFNVDFDIQISEDQKKATVVMNSANPLSAEDLIYVFEVWIGEMKQRLGETNAIRTDPA
jgi:hypothetical protein